MNVIKSTCPPDASLRGRPCHTCHGRHPSYPCQTRGPGGAVLHWGVGPRSRSRGRTATQRRYAEFTTQGLQRGSNPRDARPARWSGSANASRPDAALLRGTRGSDGSDAGTSSTLGSPVPQDCPARLCLGDSCHARMLANRLPQKQLTPGSGVGDREQRPSLCARARAWCGRGGGGRRVLRIRPPLSSTPKRASGVEAGQASTDSMPCHGMVNDRLTANAIATWIRG